MIAVDEAGQNSIVVASGANADLAAADVEAMRRVFKGASIAMFQLETPLATVAAALKLAREEGLTTILDPAPAQPLAIETLQNVDILTPNEVESKHFDLTSAHTVVVKLGEKDAWRTGRENRSTYPRSRWMRSIPRRPATSSTRGWRSRWRRGRRFRIACAALRKCSGGDQRDAARRADLGTLASGS
jgi:sugar/nucleoside kinase (ribokinase family)